MEAEDVAEKQDGALAWWEMLQGCDERELDGLPGLVSSIWTRRRIDDPLEQGVGVGLEQSHLAEPRRLRRGEWRLGCRRRPAAERAQGIETSIGGDPVEPRAQRCRAVITRQTAPGAQQRLLERVLSVLHRAEDPVAVELELPPVGVG